MYLTGRIRGTVYIFYHWEKYRNFTPNYVETVLFCKISTPGNQVKLRYFSKCMITIFLFLFSFRLKLVLFGEKDLEFCMFAFSQL